MYEVTSYFASDVVWKDNLHTNKWSNIIYSRKPKNISLLSEPEEGNNIVKWNNEAEFYLYMLNVDMFGMILHIFQVINSFSNFATLLIYIFKKMYFHVRSEQKLR